MKKTGLFALLCTLILCACGGEGDITDKIQYLPFQETEDGRWGMISTDGSKVLFSEEFKETPTVAMNDRFLVQNGEGKWEIYTAEEKPKQVGDVYKEICLFTEDVTPAVKEGKPVALIDRDGNEVKDLARLNDKVVTSVRCFHEGYAVYETAEGLCGTIDTKGNVVIDAQYCYMQDVSDGKIVATNKKYKDAGEMARVCFLNASNGKVLTELKEGESTYGSFADGCIIVGTQKDGGITYGIMDEKGEWKLPAKEKNGTIAELRDGHYIFYKDDSYGLADLNGEVLIRPKYDRLAFVADGILAARNSKKDRDERCCLLNYEGEQIGEEAFREYSVYLGDYMPVQTDRHEISFIDKSGNLAKLDKNLEIRDLSLSDGYNSVESDYVDFQGIIDALGITKEGFDGISVGTQAETAVGLVAAKKGEPVSGPEEFVYKNSLSYSKEVSSLTGNVEMYFFGNIAENIVETVTETDPYWGYTYSHDEIKGQRYTNTTIGSIQVVFDLTYTKANGKQKEFFQALSKKICTLGQKTSSAANGQAVNTGGGLYACTWYAGNKVYLLFGRGESEYFDYPEEDDYYGDISMGEATDSCAVEAAEYPLDSCAVE